MRTLLLFLVPALWLAAPALAQAPPAADAEKLPPLVKLEEKDVTGFITASDKLRQLAADEKLDVAPDAKSPGAPSASATEKALAIIGEHGFTKERFQSVGYSIGMALAADEIAKTPEELDAARAQQKQMLARMKDEVSPEQYAEMERQVAMADRMVEELRKQPPGNVELVRKYAAQIKGAVGGK